MADGTGGGWGRGPFSKRGLLEVAVKFGAIYTAKLLGEELPFDNAPFYARELACEGMFEGVPDAPMLDGVEDFALWRPTELGKAFIEGAKR